MSKWLKKSSTRRIIQVIFFLVIALIAINHTLVEMGIGIPLISSASLHALCPFGGVVTLYNLVTLGTFIQKIHISSVILLAIVMGLSLLFGTVFCSYICPLGSIQEWIGKVGRRLFKHRYNTFIPKQVHLILTYLRFVVFGLVVYVIAKSGTLMFEDIDPYNALFTFWSEEVSVKALVVLA